MMINDENKKSLAKMLRSRTLYIALGVCLLAAGAVGFNSVSKSVPGRLASEETVTQAPTYKNVNDPVFHDAVPYSEPPAPVSEQPQTQASAEPVGEITQPEAEAVFDNGSETLSEAAAADVKVELSLPVNGSLGRDYSMGLPVFSETMSDYRTHNGIDITAEPGTQVKAAAPGRVTAVIHDNVWGNTVEIDHGAGYVTRISGLADEGLVGTDCTVVPESVVGVVGTVPVESGDAPHIHFEVRLNGELQDPLEALGLTETND